MLANLVIPIVLVANGLAAGVLIGTQLGTWQLMVSQPPAQYVRTHAFYATRFDPFMPICLILTVVGDAALSVVDHGGAGERALHLLAGLLALVTVTISIVKNVPVNKWMRTLDPEDLPADFAARDPRRFWGFWNRVRGFLAVTALLANCVALAIVL
ncbi:MAG TPA: DUF1772 domain-containing protein [Pseudonocardiaceae bacterium]|jgi:uncharacterized membrane protein|nr:DUF1772 domain-containing protein [Pseudonocardiaceae bacterium]